jgi:hypothetical protein
LQLYGRPVHHTQRFLNNFEVMVTGTEIIGENFRISQSYRSSPGLDPVHRFF